MLVITKSNLKWFFILIFCLCYGYIFTLIPHEYFRDRYNYINYAKYYDYIMVNRLGNSLYSSEILFLYLNKYLSYILSPENVVYLFVFVINFILSLIFFIKGRNFLVALLGLLAFFLLPFGFTFQLGALRQALAVSLVMLALIKKKSVYITSFYIFLAGLIHTSLFVLLVFYLADFLFLKIFSQKDIVKRLLLHFSIALAISLLLSLISQQFGVDKIEMYIESGQDTGLFFIFFIPLLAYNVYQYWLNKSVDTFGIISIIGIIAYLTFYFLSPIAGRLITIFIPFIYVSMIRKFTLLNIILIIYTILIGGYLVSLGDYKQIMTI